MAWGRTRRGRGAEEFLETSLGGKLALFYVDSSDREFWRRRTEQQTGLYVKSLVLSSCWQKQTERHFRAITPS